MGRRGHLHLLFLFFLLSSLSLGPQRARAQAGALGGGSSTAPFDVGMVLDTTTWIGNISSTCMAMAVEEFYAAHTNDTTRLVLHPRESGSDAFGAASAAIDLLKNVRVEAIIGPQTSMQAKFVIELGNKTKVPVISFSAKSTSLRSMQNPYFIRTALNDSSQAEVIASIVQTFKWREAVPVYEGSEYATGIVPCLVDAFQQVDVGVPYRSVISPSATKDQILKELDKLKNMTTRVFVVHMSYSLGFQLFSIAEDNGMMGEGYVWITTYGLTDLVDIMGSSATDVMQGVLGVKPFVRKTSRLRDFNVRWRKKFYEGNPNAELNETPVFGLWAYDTVWSLALAAESVGATNSRNNLEQNISNSSTDMARLGSSQNGRELLSVMESTEFDGISGRFRLIDGQLELKTFEIINVVGREKRRIGFWSPAHGVSGKRHSKADLMNITWPGEQGKLPKGWEWPISGQRLRIGVPLKPGFSQFIDMKTTDNRTKKAFGKGYCIQVFDAAMAALPYHVPYDYYNYEDEKGDMKGTYDDLVYEVYLQHYDAVVGDVTIRANRSLYVDFTLPYTESGVSMVVPVKDKLHKSAWTFLEPLTADLWIASGAFFVFTGLVVWCLEHRINNEFRGTPEYQFGTVFYFAFSTLVFAHREKVVSNLARVVVIIWLFVVLILTSSYTASLTSMLTVQQLQPTVTDVDDLVKNGDSVGYLNDSFMPGLLKRMKFDPSKLIAYSSPDEYDKALSNGTVAAIVDEIPYLKVFLSQFCNKYTMVGPIYKTGGFGFAFPKGSPLVPDLSRAILTVTEGQNINATEDGLYGNQSCTDPGDSSSSSLTFNSFWGLFLITGITSMFVLILHLVFFLYEHRDILRTDGFDNSVYQKFALMAKLFNQRDNSTHAVKRADATEGPATGDIMASPYSISALQSPSSIMASPYSISALQSPSSMSDSTLGNFGPEEEVGTTLEEEGTPEREITSQTPEPPSFAEMLNRRS